MVEDKFSAKQILLSQNTMMLGEAEKTDGKAKAERTSKANFKKFKDMVSSLKKEPNADKLLKEKSSILELTKLTIVTAGAALTGAWAAWIGFLVFRFLKTEVNDLQRKKLKDNLEDQLKVVDEELEDAKKEGNKEQKLKLVKMKSTLERNIKKLEERGV